MACQSGLRAPPHGRLRRRAGALIRRAFSALRRLDTPVYMVNDIMQTTQLESRSVVIERFPASISGLMEQLRAYYQLGLDKPEVKLLWEYPSEPIEIQIDGAKLKQVLQNLINNAVKFTDKGTVTVSARVVEEKGEKWVVFAVADTGVGIPHDQLALIFDKFHQVDSSETRLYSGVGLGLYIVKKFTELLGGTIEVESVPDQGSTFTVTIPLAHSLPS